LSKKEDPAVLKSSKRKYLDQVWRRKKRKKKALDRRMHKMGVW